MVAQDLYALVRWFKADEPVKALPSYALLVRLLADQCNVTGGETDTPAVSVKEGKEVVVGPQNGLKNSMGPMGRTSLFEPPSGPQCRELPAPFLKA